MCCWRVSSKLIVNLCLFVSGDSEEKNPAPAAIAVEVGLQSSDEDEEVSEGPENGTDPPASTKDLEGKFYFIPFIIVYHQVGNTILNFLIS